VTWLSRGFVDLGLTGYVWAAIQAVLEFRRGGRGAWLVPTRAIVVTAWGCHTAGLLLRWLVEGTSPVAGLHQALSLIVWAAVLLVLWGERRDAMRALPAFGLPPVALLGLGAAAVPERLVFQGGPEPALLAHAMAVTLGLGALAGNFAGGLMYVLQENAIRSRRIDEMSRRLPSLDALDRFSFHALLVGFPFLTLGIALGTVSAALVHGVEWLWQPTPLVASLTWLAYGMAIYLRGAIGWGGRRAAYLAVASFALLVLTVGVSLLLPTRHVAL
jgi:ABC-type transport system involved in cytochrome c biogenesis permease subunit